MYRLYIYIYIPYIYNDNPRIDAEPCIHTQHGPKLVTLYKNLDVTNRKDGL